MANAEPDPAPDAVAIPIAWVGIDEQPPFAANQMVVQHTAVNEFLLTFGHLTTPVVFGDEHQRREQLEQVSFVAIKPVARVAFNRDRLKELIGALQQNLEQHGATFGIKT